MYSMTYAGQEKRTAKGITRACQRQMKHDHYKRSLFDKTQTTVVGHSIRSHDHELFSEKVNLHLMISAMSLKMAIPHWLMDITAYK
jgi:hypothetical protein